MGFEPTTSRLLSGCSTNSAQEASDNIFHEFNLKFYFLAIIWRRFFTAALLQGGGAQESGRESRQGAGVRREGAERAQEGGKGAQGQGVWRGMDGIDEHRRMNTGARHC